MRPVCSPGSRTILPWLLLAGSLVSSALAQSTQISPPVPIVQGVPEASLLPSDAEIRGLLAQRIDVEKEGVGIVVGVIEPAGRRVIVYGAMDQGDARPLDGTTVFEIGSVTKVFTCLLLADMVERGELRLTDPVAQYLPPGLKLPQRGGRSITLEDLATQRSGLPRMPSNLNSKDAANPYAEYTVADLYAFLARFQLTREPGSQYEYSNLGMGLLGQALSQHAGMGYEQLVRARILFPLGMTSTGIALPGDAGARMAIGHDLALHAVERWDLPALAGAGALRSSANDLLRMLSVELGYSGSSLAPAMALMLAQRHPTTMAHVEVGLGWHVLTLDGHEIVWHNGGTGGFRAYIAFDRQRRIGVVVLGNAETGAGVDDLGLHLLDAAVPVQHMMAVKPRTAVPVDASLFDGYIGRYQLAPGVVMTITREGTRLFAQVTGQVRLEIFSEGSKDYFFQAVDAQISFVTDARGQATSLILHQGGENQTAGRVQ